MTTVRRAHMVSKGYLRAWADARNTVDVVDIQQGRGFPSSIVNATVASYAYDTAVLTHDLEREYGRIEDSGIPVILKLHNGDMTLTEAERSAMIAFLDMHLNRGRYADQTEVRIPAVLLRNGGELKEAELSLGDRLLLSQPLTDVVRSPRSVSNNGRGVWSGDSSTSPPETEQYFCGARPTVQRSAQSPFHSPRRRCS